MLYSQIDMSTINRGIDFGVESTDEKRDLIEFHFTNRSMCDYTITTVVTQQTKIQIDATSCISKNLSELNKFSDTVKIVDCCQVYEMIDHFNFLNFSKSFKVTFFIHCCKGSDEKKQILPLIKKYTEDHTFSGVEYYSADCAIFCIPIKIEKTI